MPTSYTVQWNTDPANSRRTPPPQFLPACFSSDLRKLQDRVWRRLGGAEGSCPTCPSPVATLMELLHKESFLLASNNADYNDVDVRI